MWLFWANTVHTIQQSARRHFDVRSPCLSLKAMTILLMVSPMPTEAHAPDIRTPGPELATFPENVDTLPSGNAYVEVSAFGYVGGDALESGQFNTPFLLEYGLTDDIELRLYDNGFSWQEGSGHYRGFEPPTFGALIHLLDEDPDHYLPAMAFEPLITTDLLGNDNTRGGIQPVFQFTFVNTLPLDIEFNYTLGVLRSRNIQNQNNWEFQFEWAFQRSFFSEDLDLFVHGTYNTADITLPNSPSPSSIYGTSESVMGGGFIWTALPRLSLYGQISGGLNQYSPSVLSWAGFAVAF